MASWTCCSFGARGLLSCCATSAALVVPLPSPRAEQFFSSNRTANHSFSPAACQTAVTKALASLAHLYLIHTVLVTTMKSGSTTSIINNSGCSSGGDGASSAKRAAAERKLQKQTKTPGKGMVTKRLSDSFISTKKSPAADLGLAGLDGSIDDCEFIKCIGIGINGIAPTSSYSYLTIYCLLLFGPCHTHTSPFTAYCYLCLVPPFDSCHQYQHSMLPCKISRRSY